MINKISHYFERIIVIILLTLMSIVIVISTVELVASIVNDIIHHNRSNGFLFLNMQDMLQMFSFILLIVIGLELFETIKYYLNKHTIKSEFILMVALTAIARKIIVLDYTKIDATMLMSIAASILALSAGYYLIKRADNIKSKSID